MATSDGVNQVTDRVDHRLAEANPDLHRAMIE